jgi:beta-lactamase regulating signal transducer with metallopeptidase domain
MVAVWLIAKYLHDYIGNFRPIMNWMERCERDECAESMLADIIGYDKKFYVFRNSCVNTAMATAVKPYIILPEVEFPPDELRIILLHEWKHIQDKDYLSRLIVDIITCVFWWNPMVYILRKNYYFAMELKCDHFSISNKKDFKHYINGHLLLESATEARIKSRLSNAFVSNDEEYNDRFKALYLQAKQGTSRSKRIFANVFYSIVIVALFFVSYMFMFLPISRQPSDDVIFAEDFTDEYTESGGIFRAGENFAIDNGDGTFSIYINGEFLRIVDNTNEILNLLPIRTR